MIILSSVSGGLLLWSVNHTSIYEKPWIKFVEEISKIDQMVNLEHMYTKLLNLVDNCF